MSKPEEISYDDLATELGQACDRIKAIGGLHGGGLEDAHESHYRSWVGRLSALQSQPTSADIRKVTTAICKGPWNPSQQDELIGIITNIKKTKKKTTKQRRKGQTCITFENMISADCYVKLKDKDRFSQNSRLSIMASCARAINLINPCEQTRFHMVKLLAYCEDNWELTQRDVLKLMDKVREYIQAGKSDTSLPYLEQYPTSAADLPEVLRKRAFGNDVHVDVCMPDLDGVLSGRKKRGREREDLAWMQQVPEPYRSKICGLINQPSAESSVSRNAIPKMPSIDMFRYGIPITKASTGISAKKEMEEEKKEEKGGIKGEPTGEWEEDGEEEEEEEEEEKEEQDGDIDGMEKKMVAAYKQAKKVAAMRRPAAAAKAKVATTAAKATPIVKRPAGAGVKRRPAAAAAFKKLDMTHIFTRLRQRNPIGTQNQFTSAAYHPARKLALRAGHSTEEAKDVARAAFKKASDLYARLT
jgi:hypothetical protein